jgi:hypothetical protein
MVGGSKTMSLPEATLIYHGYRNDPTQEGVLSLAAVHAQLLYAAPRHLVCTNSGHRQLSAILIVVLMFYRRVHLDGGREQDHVAARVRRLRARHLRRRPLDGERQGENGDVMMMMMMMMMTLLLLMMMMLLLLMMMMIR